MIKVISQIIASAFGLWIATTFVPGVIIELYPNSNFFGFNLTSRWYIFLLLGIILGLINHFIKPILDTITFPLRVITLGLFGFVINMALVWAVDVMFREFSAPLIYPLLYTTLIIWALNVAISIIFKQNN